MANTDPIKWALFDTDLTTKLGFLPSGQSHLYLEINEPGSGELRIPLDCDLAAGVASAQFAQASYRGASRGGFFVENIKQVDADSNEGGGRLLSISGRGALALMEDAQVWKDQFGNSKRSFEAMSKAGMLIQLIDEAIARGALLTLTYDFTDTLDSDGNTWSESTNLEFPVGQSLLEVLRSMADTIDFDMTPDGSGGYILSAYKNGIGTDRSATIKMRIGTNCTEVESQELGGKIKNVHLVKFGSGMTMVKDNTSIALRRRREGFLNAEYVSDVNAALSYGQAQLTLTKDPQDTRTLKVFDGIGPKLFEDYGMGDTITLDRFGVEAEYRIRGIQADWDGEGYANVELNLNSIQVENQLQLNRDVRWLMDLWNTAHDSDLLNVNYWAALGHPDNNGIVYAMYLDGTTLYIGGAFTHFGGIDANRIATYDILTGLWSALGTGMNGTVYAITKMGTNIVVSGSFTTGNGVSVARIAFWNGSTFVALGTGITGTAVLCLAVIGSDLYAGGTALSVAGGVTVVNIARWDGSWHAVGSGPGVCENPIGGGVFAFAVNGSDLYLCGQFTQQFGGSANTLLGVAKWNGSVFSALGTGVDGVGKVGRDVMVLGDYLYLVGDFDSVSGETAPGVARWHLTDLAWESLDGEGGGLTGTIYSGFSLGNDGINVYIGGNFEGAGTDVDNTSSFCGWNGGSFFALGGGVSSYTRAIICYGADVYVGGDFLYIDGDASTGKSSKYFGAWLTTFESVIDYLEDRYSNFDLARAIHNATAKSPIVAADEMGFWDSVSNALRKITWTNILATIKTYTDTLYIPQIGTVGDGDVTGWDGTTGNVVKSLGTQNYFMANATQAAGNVPVPADNDKFGFFNDDLFNYAYMYWSDIKAFLNSFFREKLTANRTYYVRTDGSDSNTGLANTAGGAFLTIQKAIDVALAIDTSIYNVTIQLGAGTYTSPSLLLGLITGSGSITIIGDATTPSNVIISASSAGIAQFYITGERWVLDGFRLNGNTNSIGLSVSVGYAAFQNTEFNTNMLAHAIASNGGLLYATGNYSILSGATRHFWADNEGRIIVQSRTITLTGTPAFSQFALASNNSVMKLNGCTWTGSATGQRYNISENSTIFMNNEGETALPGNALGARATGGVYSTSAQVIRTSRVSTQFDKTNTTLATITGLSATLLAGRTYKGKVILYTTSNVAGGVKTDFDGGTATATSFIAEAQILQAGVLIAPTTARSTALATDIADVTAVTVATIEIDFQVTVNAAGTFIPRFACNAAVGTSSVLVGSSMTIEDVTNTN